MRAVAVLAVMLFHAGALLPGGFVGVDIFFVISGYLITSIVVREIRDGVFSYAGFYERRIRRLLPPLIPVLLVTSVGSAAILSPLQFDDYRRSLLATLGFGGNWHFLSTVGYFDGESDLKPLLHMWSLGVEEQYYLLMPGCVLFLLRLRLTPLVLLSVATFASLLTGIVLVWIGSLDSAFYNSFARFWELLAGSLLALLRTPRFTAGQVTLLELGGASLLVLPLFWYTDSTPFPGIAAIPPVVGTALVLAGGGSGRLVAPVLKSPLLNGIGRISYALYLWHWPILVFIRLYWPTSPQSWFGYGLAASFLLSALSYFVLERPVRRKTFMRTRRACFALFGVFTAVVALGAVVMATDRFEAHRTQVAGMTRAAVFGELRARVLNTLNSEETLYLERFNINFTGTSGDFDRSSHGRATCSFDRRNTWNRVVECLKGQAAGAPIVLVVGDSVGRDTMWSLRRAFPAESFLMLHQSSCPPADFERPTRGRCFPGLAGIFETLAESGLRFKAIVLAFRYRPDEWRAMDQSVALVRRYTQNVLLFGPLPWYRDSLAERVQRLGAHSLTSEIEKADTSMFSWSLDTVRAEVESFARSQNLQFVDVARAFCGERSCAGWNEGHFDEPLLWDTTHLTRHGVARMADFLKSEGRLASIFGP